MNPIVYGKQWAKRLLPPAIHRRGAEIYRGVLNTARDAATTRRLGTPGKLFFFGFAPGDDLICTAVFRELKLRGQEKIWMISGFPELFAGNEDVACVVPTTPYFKGYLTRRGYKGQDLEYAGYDPQLDRGQPTNRPVIAELCARAGVTGKVAVRPYLNLQDGEREKAQWAADKIVIQNCGFGARLQMANKQWYPDRFQAVVDRLKHDFEFIQIGMPNDPPLSNARDLRGKTSLRESAALLSHARLCVGIEGFVMHLARAVECPSVIVLGGRTAPWQFGYSCNENLYSPVPCSPCWLWNKCDHDRMCMKQIETEDVVAAIQRVLARPRNPLPVDAWVI